MGDPHYRHAWIADLSLHGDDGSNDGYIVLCKTNGVELSTRMREIEKQHPEHNPEPDPGDARAPALGGPGYGGCLM